MGKFINTQTTDMVTSLVDGVKERLKNPYYMNSNLTPTIADYYPINREMSTLDEGVKIAQSYTGDNSPIKYNIIRDFYFYGGFEQIQLQMDNGEFGLQAETITGSTNILPNTIKPSAGDLFRILYLENDYLFRVTNVEYDTLEFGSNMYKIDFEFHKNNIDCIKDLIVDEYTMVCVNDNAKFATIIKKTEFDYAAVLEDVTITLKDYYLELFYKNRVETVVFNEFDENFYDPILMEFIVRNNILDYGVDKYIYMNHAIIKPYGFILDYDKSFLHHIETKNKAIRSPRFGFGEFINQPQSLLSMMKESYFSVKYIKEPTPMTMEIFCEDLFNRISSGELYFKEEKIIPDYKKTDKYKGTITILVDSIQSSYKGVINVLPAISDDEKHIYDIIIKYFNNIKLSADDITFIQNFEYIGSRFLYYFIPILIYILEAEIKAYLKL